MLSVLELSCGSDGGNPGELEAEKILGDDSACTKLLRRLLGLTDPADDESSCAKILGGVGNSGVLDPENILMVQRNDKKN